MHTIVKSSGSNVCFRHVPSLQLFMNKLLKSQHLNHENQMFQNLKILRGAPGFLRSMRPSTALPPCGPPGAGPSWPVSGLGRRATSRPTRRAAGARRDTVVPPWPIAFSCCTYITPKTSITSNNDIVYSLCILYIYNPYLFSIILQLMGLLKRKTIDI